MDEQFRKHGAFSWCELMTPNPSSARDFYTKLFGWTTEEMNTMPGMTYTVVKVGGSGIGGIMPLPQQGMHAAVGLLCHRRRCRCNGAHGDAAWRKDTHGTAGYS